MVCVKNSKIRVINRCRHKTCGMVDTNKNYKNNCLVWTIMFANAWLVIKLYLLENDVSNPWLIDLLNLEKDRGLIRRRIQEFLLGLLTEGILRKLKRMLLLIRKVMGQF
jgi:hypothetical protein